MALILFFQFLLILLLIIFSIFQLLLHMALEHTLFKEFLWFLFHKIIWIELPFLVFVLLITNVWVDFEIQPN